MLQHFSANFYGLASWRSQISSAGTGLIEHTKVEPQGCYQNKYEGEIEETRFWGVLSQQEGNGPIYQRATGAMSHEIFAKCQRILHHSLEWGIYRDEIYSLYVVW